MAKRSSKPRAKPAPRSSASVGQDTSGWRNWGDHPLVVLITVLASIVAIIAFISGAVNLSSLIRQNIVEDGTSPVPVTFTPSVAPLTTSPAPTLDTALEPTVLPFEELGDFSSLTEAYYDDFSSRASGWNEFGYRDGWYVIDQDHGGGTRFEAWEAIGKMDSGVLLQVDVLGPFAEQDHAIRGIGFGSLYGSETGVYAFTIDQKGECKILEYRDFGDYEAFDTKATARIDSFVSNKGYYTLRVKIDHYREVKGYVDGEFCVQYTMTDYVPGYVGLIASPSIVALDYQAGESYFDEFRVFRLP